MQKVESFGLEVLLQKAYNLGRRLVLGGNEHNRTSPEKTLEYLNKQNIVKILRTQRCIDWVVGVSGGLGPQFKEKEYIPNDARRVRILIYG